MRNIRVITDSACDLSTELVKKYGITVIKQLLFRIVSVQIYHQHLVLQTVGQNIPMVILFSTILRHLLF